MDNQQTTANATGGARAFRLAYDEGTGRWMVIAVGENSRGVRIPVRFFGPYDNELAARRQVTTLQRSRKEAAFRQRLERLSDA